MSKFNCWLLVVLLVLFIAISIALSMTARDNRQLAIEANVAYYEDKTGAFTYKDMR